MVAEFFNFSSIMKNKLLVRLIILLMTLAVASLVVNTKLAADGFFVNLATEFIGIVFTVGYVDRILRKHKEEQWSGAASRIDRQIHWLCNSAVTKLRSSFGYSFNSLNQSIMMSGKVSEMSAELMKVVDQLLAPAVRNCLVSLDQAGWKLMANDLQDISEEAGRLLDRFGYCLSQAQIEQLLDIQNSIHPALVFYRAFSHFMGIPPEKIPQSTNQSHLLQKNVYDETARHIVSALQAIKRLSELSLSPDA